MSCDPKVTTYYGLSPAALERIRALSDAIPDGRPSTPGLYSPIYQEILDQVKNDPNVDQGTKNWLEIAVQVNKGDPRNLVYQYVKTETQTALGERATPINISDSRFMEGSNALGKSIADRILKEGALPSAAGQDGVVEKDANAVVKELGGDISDWAGITPYGIGDPYLGVDSSRFNPDGKEKGFDWYARIFDKAMRETIKASPDATQFPDHHLEDFAKKYLEQVLNEMRKAAGCEIDKAVEALFKRARDWFRPRDPVVLGQC